MRILLDENIGRHRLLKALTAAGHDVVRSVDELGGGTKDPAVFAHAREKNRVLMTLDVLDFEALAASAPDHPGMLFIHQGNQPKDLMSDERYRARRRKRREHIPRWCSWRHNQTQRISLVRVQPPTELSVP